MDETTKPKRGRKPKEVSLADDSDKKKRGRKPKSTYSVSENASAAPLCLSDDENVIVRLQVPDDDTDNILENPPCAYNKDKYNMIQGFDAIEDNDASLPHVQDELKVMDVLKDFEEKNKNNEWPSNTSTCCYWCCHKFDNSPFGIPVNFSNGHFEVFGCFCSLECAAAYNFKDNESIDEVWERYNLINLLSRKVGLGRIVKPAPDKITLKMFGGFMDIEAFRSYSGTNKVMNVNFPPMTSLTQQIEEINEYELNSDLRYIPLDNERINRCKEKMIFKRNKPLISEKTTLESSMNVKFMN
jgi:hypothetical protein